MEQDYSVFTREDYGRRQLWLLFAAVMIFIMHSTLGASPAVLCVALLTVFLGIHSVVNFGMLNIGALFCLLVMFRHVGFPLLGKILFLQPLDSNLNQPLSAFFAVFSGLLFYQLALMILMKLSFKRTLLERITDPRRLLWISALSMIIGCVANFSIAMHAGVEYNGITIANFFVPFLHLSLISAIAAELSSSGGQKTWNYWVVLIIIAEIAFALVRNSRIALVEVVMCYVFTLSAFQGKVRWPRIVCSGLLALLLVAAITPVMLYVRGFRDNLTWSQRITATLEAASDWSIALTHFKAAELLQERHGFYLNYYGSPQNILERISLVNHVDVMMSATDRHVPVGIKDLFFAIQRNLPRTMAPGKPVGFSHGSWLNCKANIECIEGSFATVPLIANGYAAFGWAGVIIYPFLFGFAVLLLIRLVSGLNLNRNIWAIYFLMRFQNNFVEGDAATYFQGIIRDIPQDMVLLIAITWISGIAFQEFHKRAESP